MVTAFIKLLVQMNSSAIIALGQIGFVGIAISLWLSGLTPAQIVAQLAIIGVITSRVLPHVNRVMGLINTLQTSLPIVDALLAIRQEITDAKQKYPDPNGKTVLPDDWKGLTFRNAGFTYPEAMDSSLQGLNFTLERGKSYGVVGPSGAGKSTFVNLLLGLLPVSEGEILVDDLPLRDINLEQWRGQCGYVAQDVFILDESLRHNITFRNAVDDQALLETVIETTRLRSFIDGLPAGLDSPIGEAGKLVSGGQAQRISIARALYRQPDILILDEATSALDSITEKELQQRLEETAGNRLTLAIAHRLTTLRNCDCIFVLDQGQVVASGDWDSLMQQSGLFRQLAANPEGQMS